MSGRPPSDSEDMPSGEPTSTLFRSEATFVASGPYGTGNSGRSDARCRGNAEVSSAVPPCRWGDVSGQLSAHTLFATISAVSLHFRVVSQIYDVRLCRCMIVPRRALRKFTGCRQDLVQLGPNSVEVASNLFNSGQPGLNSANVTPKSADSWPHPAGISTGSPDFDQI